MHKIGLIDYGMGNIHSVTKSLESLGEEIILIKNFNESKNCKAIILPGVGAFDPAMINLINMNLKNDLQNWICLLYTSPSPRDVEESRMPSSA